MMPLELRAGYLVVTQLLLRLARYRLGWLCARRDVRLSGPASHPLGHFGRGPRLGLSRRWVNNPARRG
jgi:hypothetical protein